MCRVHHFPGHFFSPRSPFPRCTCWICVDRQSESALPCPKPLVLPPGPLRKTCRLSYDSSAASAASKGSSSCDDSSSDPSNSSRSQIHESLVSNSRHDEHSCHIKKDPSAPLDCRSVKMQVGRRQDGRARRGKIRLGRDPPADSQRVRCREVGSPAHLS